MKRRMEEYERTELLVVWKEEIEKRKKIEEGEKAWFATTSQSVSFLYWTESED